MHKLKNNNNQYNTFCSQNSYFSVVQFVYVMILEVQIH